MPCAFWPVGDGVSRGLTRASYDGPTRGKAVADTCRPAAGAIREGAFMGMGTSSVLRSADLQDGIDFEVGRERVNLMVAKKIRQMSEAGTLYHPTDEDLAELRRLEALRGNGALVG